MRRLTIPVAIAGMAVAALVIYSHVAAQDSGACSVTEGGSSARISACSKLIENGNLKGDQLADALFARGAAYDDDHQYGRQSRIIPKLYVCILLPCWRTMRVVRRMMTISSLTSHLPTTMKPFD